MKKKKKHFNLYRFSLKLFCATGLIFLFTAIFLRAINSSLNVAVQTDNDTIAALEREIDADQMEVNQLSAYDRIVTIANADGMYIDTDNVATISNE